MLKLVTLVFSDYVLKTYKLHVFYIYAAARLVADIASNKSPA